MGDLFNQCDSSLFLHVKNVFNGGSLFSHILQNKKRTKLEADSVIASNFVKVSFVKRPNPFGDIRFKSHNVSKSQNKQNSSMILFLSAIGQKLNK